MTTADTGETAGVAEAGAHEPGFAIRPARPSDARSFLDLWRAVVAERRFVRTDDVTRGGRHYRKMFRRSWTGDQAIVVAVDGPWVIGHLTVSREAHPVTRHVASLGIAVARDRRRSGVASALMVEAIRWARAVGVEKLALSVYPDNEAAVALYRKFGFVEEGRLTGHSKKRVGYRDEIVMGLWLTDRSGEREPSGAPGTR